MVTCCCPLSEPRDEPATACPTLFRQLLEYAVTAVEPTWESPIRTWRVPTWGHSLPTRPALPTRPRSPCVAWPGHSLQTELPVQWRRGIEYVPSRREHRLLQRCTTGHYHSFASYLDPYQTTPSPGLDAARPPTTMSRSIPLNRNCLGLPSVVHVPLLIPTAICATEPIRAKTAEPDRSVQTSQCDSKTWRCNPVGAGRPAAVKTIFIDGRREDVRSR